MSTDYLLFIHGVNTRESASDPTYANQLFDLIKGQARQRAAGLQPQKVALYWGDVARDAEEQLKSTYQQAPTWPQFWFQRTREKLLLQFIGDVVLYISRAESAHVSVAEDTITHKSPQ
ncbi:MAG TPA: hypothetical protein VKB35_16200 [Ktedonobacteraceae bacterium]|nr:hypothetical protein [Ktedonobacteraceae bacterium]